MPPASARSAHTDAARGQIMRGGPEALARGALTGTPPCQAELRLCLVTDSGVDGAVWLDAKSRVCFVTWPAR